MKLPSLMIATWLSCLCFNPQAAEYPEDLTQFEYPLLLGRWYMANTSDETVDLRNISLDLESNYHFNIRIQKRNNDVDSWTGTYSVGSDFITLGLDGTEPQIFQYQNNHHQLLLNGIVFKKLIPQFLPGIWTSLDLSGRDLLANQIVKIDLYLSPDFLFSFQSFNKDGKLQVRNGVYLIEKDNIVFLFEKGELAAQYYFNHHQQLVLTSNSKDMNVVLGRRADD